MTRRRILAGWSIGLLMGETSMLSLVRNDKIVYEDAYRLANDADLAGGAVGLYEHWTPWSEDVGQVFVACQKGPEYSVELDGNSLKKWWRPKRSLWEECRRISNR